jgi:hypothetical protein
MLSTVGFAAGGAALTTGVILMFMAPKAKRANDTAVTPLVGPGFLGVNGRFW